MAGRVSIRTLLTPINANDLLSVIVQPYSAEPAWLKREVPWGSAEYIIAAAKDGANRHTKAGHIATARSFLSHMTLILKQITHEKHVFC